MRCWVWLWYRSCRILLPGGLEEMLVGRQLDDREVIHLQESWEKPSEVVGITPSQRHGRPNNYIYDGVRCVTGQWAMGGRGGLASPLLPGVS